MLEKEKAMLEEEKVAREKECEELKKENLALLKKVNNLEDVTEKIEEAERFLAEKQTRVLVSGDFHLKCIPLSKCHWQRGQLPENLLQSKLLAKCIETHNQHFKCSPSTCKQQRSCLANPSSHDRSHF